MTHPHTIIDGVDVDRLMHKRIMMWIVWPVTAIAVAAIVGFGLVDRVSAPASKRVTVPPVTRSPSPRLSARATSTAPRPVRSSPDGHPTPSRTPVSRPTPRPAPTVNSIHTQAPAPATTTTKPASKAPSPSATSGHCIINVLGICI